MLRASFFSEITLYRPYLMPIFQSVMALQKPFHIAKFGHLPEGRPETHVNREIEDRQAGNPRKH